MSLASRYHSALLTATLSVALAAGATSTANAQAPGGFVASPQLTEAQRLVTQRKYADAVPVLRELLKSQPLLGPAWMSLGAAQRGLGMADSAIAAYEQAAKRPGVARQAALQLLIVNAEQNHLDEAVRWLEQVRASRLDFSSIRINKEIENLRNDPRFAVLFPAPADFAKPFVEPVHIIHEWRGEAAGDEFGWIARGIGDVDKDGVTDVAVTATANAPSGNTIGKVYAYSGKTGKLLWKKVSVAGAFFGNTLESAGDVNRDGIPDVIVGAPGLNGFFIYSGLDGREIRKVTGDSSVTDLGSGVAGVGDLNHDGYADVIASAPSANAGKGAGTGRVYIYSGKDFTPLLVLDGDAPGDSFGSTVGAGDGRHFVVGAAGANGSGRVYAYDGLSSTPIFTRQADSTGVALGAMFASVVGDVNGDGVADMYATDFANTIAGPGSGRAYIYSGKTGEPLYVKSGSSPGEGMGIGAGRTGDVNVDGFADFVVAGWQYAGAAWSGGRVQVFSGKDGSLLQSFTGRVPGETLGFDAVGVGDVDGDGTTDYLLTSAWSLVNGVRSGRVYIVSGTVKKKRTSITAPTDPAPRRAPQSSASPSHPAPD